MSTTLAAQAVGSTVTLNVDGAAVSFLVVQQGCPDSSLYDGCDGTWLLMQDVYSERIFGSANDYAASTLHTWLNGTFLSKLDSGIQQAVQTAGLPCFDGEAVRSGADGVSAKIFLLSMREMGTPASQKANLADEGVLLDYFEDGDGNEEPLRAASDWYWTRSPSTANGDDVWAVAGSSGKCACRDVSYSYGVRPALILPQAMPSKVIRLYSSVSWLSVIIA